MPKPQSKDLQKIRSELNLEKWTIWQPTNSRSQADEKVMQRNINLPDGSQLSTKVEVVYTTKGVLTTEDQKVYYALIKIWEEKGRPIEKTVFSMREIARILGRSWGSDIAKGIEQSLMRLRITSFIWENSFYDNAAKEKFELLEAFSILSDLKISRREKGKNTRQDVSSFRFNDLILKNLNAGYTKPTLLDVVIGFQSEIAQLLYSRIDLILADKESYERKSKELFEDLGLLRKSYTRPGKRKQMLEKALEELEGSPISTGIISSASIQKTRDEKDYKVVFLKQREIPDDNDEGKNLPILSAIPELPFNNENEIDTKQSEKLLQYFYQSFHKLRKNRYNQKELEQATKLIAQYGFEAACHVIDYSLQVTRNTDYLPQTLHGIVQYTDKAIAEFGRSTRQQELDMDIMNCTLCDDYGMVTLVDNHDQEFRTHCLHNDRLMDEMERRRGVKRLKPR